jgi:MFS family permease
VISADARILLQTRGLRAFGDGMVSVVLAVLLKALGMSEVQIGAIVTATLLGSAITTLVVGLKGHRIPRRTLLQAATMLMAATGIGFAVFDTFWALLVVGLVGTLNPSGGDVSLFLPTEQALLPGTTPDEHRTSLFARYALVGSLVAAVGSLCAGLPDWLARRFDIDQTTALRIPFVIYALLAFVIAFRYRRLSPRIEPDVTGPIALHASRWIVYRLAVLFSVDSFGGGFVITALLVVWLQNRFGLSLAVSGAIFFWAGLLSAFSALVAARIATRIGLVRTMVYTHLPANGLLIATAFMPNVWLAVGCLLLRSALSQMDVPARTSYVMAVVTPAERPAAASVTNVPRSLASAVPPIIAGWMLARTTFGWPLVIGGTIKATYDLLLLAQFRELRPPEEMVKSRSGVPAPRRSE